MIILLLLLSYSSLVCLSKPLQSNATNPELSPFQGSFNARTIGLNFMTPLSPPEHMMRDDIHVALSLSPTGPEKCGNQTFNLKLCPIPESGCHNDAHGHTCLCSHTLEPVDPVHGCSTRIVVDPRTEFKHPGKLERGQSAPLPDHPHGIPLPDIFNQPDGYSNKGSKRESLHYSTIVISVTVAIAILFLVATLTFIYLCKNSRRVPAQGPNGGQVATGTLVKCIQQYVSNPNYHPGNNLSKLIREIEISPDDVTFSEQDKIGEGAFGRVYKGLYRKKTLIDGEEEVLTVAVKALKSGLSAEAEADFEREIEILSGFNHQNIIKLLGVTKFSESDPLPCIVFEFMESGDLAELLRSRSPDALSKSSNSSDELELSKDDLIWIAAQIANGMLYLSQQKFVHRDLACRNCLVGNNLTVKISDFGMSRDIYTCDYYRISGQRLLPIRWMSPESILYGKFTLESDIWAFGVVLWEIFSFGKQPYFGHSNEEVVKLILHGILLMPPERCPEFILKIMSMTWKSNPKERINFPLILDIFMVNCKEERRKKLQVPKKRSSSSNSSSLISNIYHKRSYRSGSRSLTASNSSSASSSAASAITVTAAFSSHPVPFVLCDDVRIDSVPLDPLNLRNTLGPRRHFKSQKIHQPLNPQQLLANGSASLGNCTEGNLNSNTNGTSVSSSAVANCSSLNPSYVILENRLESEEHEQVPEWIETNVDEEDEESEVSAPKQLEKKVLDEEKDVEEEKEEKETGRKKEESRGDGPCSGSTAIRFNDVSQRESNDDKEEEDELADGQDEDNSTQKMDQNTHQGFSSPPSFNYLLPSQIDFTSATKCDV